ncbi:DNA modification system-associated small protein [Vibrio tritonius]|uniref:DNA modification system-associated small protein n=1 Tax=Vibrio tritonius TaxID=1435069 RepID=UPI000837F98B|nr:DNA modification system-associated small protein [Vibrio tritonius]
MNKSDPLSVLLKIKEQKGLLVADDLIKQCYQLQSAHQYDKERITLKKMEALIEDELVKDEEYKLI